jgi:hypothetical protein
MKDTRIFVELAWRHGICGRVWFELAWLGFFWLLYTGEYRLELSSMLKYINIL